MVWGVLWSLAFNITLWGIFTSCSEAPDDVLVTPLHIIWYSVVHENHSHVCCIEQGLGGFSDVISWLGTLENHDRCTQSHTCSNITDTCRSTQYLSRNMMLIIPVKITCSDELR